MGQKNAASPATINKTVKTTTAETVHRLTGPPSTVTSVRKSVKADAKGTDTQREGRQSLRAFLQEAHFRCPAASATTG